jgi:hypothetical protein
MGFRPPYNALSQLMENMTPLPPTEIRQASRAEAWQNQSKAEHHSSIFA